ncbi:LysR substrate-binding domain-containing protein [Polaromonas sp.]|uniref:LysR substrate-binding domain-containing protein n=1 Tax=Polaromonas sp. TaxID=1869339 RepID=UPI00286A4187|nr:LysR substrate-binding domain-containing protein [Polaromonas sp.]
MFGVFWINLNIAPLGAARQRRIAARVLNFSAVPPLLAQTDLLATLPVVAMHEALERFGLCALPTPFPVPPLPHRFVWSARLASDPALRWLRAILAQCFAEVLQGSGVGVSARRAAGRRTPVKKA